MEYIYSGYKNKYNVQQSNRVLLGVALPVGLCAMLARSAGSQHPHVKASTAFLGLPHPRQ